MSDDPGSPYYDPTIKKRYQRYLDEVIDGHESGGMLDLSRQENCIVKSGKKMRIVIITFNVSEEALENYRKQKESK